MSWNTEDGVFFFELSNMILNSDDPETKRSLLSLTSKVFDPMGLLAPFILDSSLEPESCFTNCGVEGYIGMISYLIIFLISGQLGRLSSLILMRFVFQYTSH